jgi:hypothetical protein
LAVVPEKVNSHNGVIKFWIVALRNVVIEMFLVSQGIQALENEFEQGFEIFGTGTGDEDI